MILYSTISDLIFFKEGSKNNKLRHGGLDPPSHIKGRASFFRQVGTSCEMLKQSCPVLNLIQD
jgi:hypothetical protein